MHELTHLDLCSGIGGFALAARWAGFCTVAFSEIDAYCGAVLRKHWPEVQNFGDLKTADFSKLKPTLITAGYPCQPFSYAGKRNGEADDRHLWPAVLAAIRTVRPAWFIGENVAGHITLGLDCVLADLESEDYEARPFVVPACAVNAPHRRDRVWIVANATGKRLEGTSRYELQKNGTRFARSSEEYRRQWITEPRMGRVAYGIPNRVDRIKSLGNAIVPQVAYEILRCIAQIENTHDQPH